MSVSIRIVNKNKKDSNNKLYEEAVNYFMLDLLKRKTKRVSGNVRIDVKINAQMQDDGECFHKNLKDNTTVIRIKFNKNISFLDKIVTLRHECVHAKQFIVSDLDISTKNFIWKNKKYPVLSPNDNNYKLQPWEKEAYLKQKKLAIKFLNFYIASNSFN